MKHLFVLLGFIICLNSFSQDSARIYMNVNFEAVDDIKNAVIIRDALINNDRYYISDQYVDGRKIMKGEYSSVDPWIEDGPFIYYDHKGRKYAEGNFRNGSMDGRWIYYDSIGTDTVIYEARWNEIVKTVRTFKTFSEFDPISKGLEKFIQSKAHYPPKLLFDCVMKREAFQLYVNKEKEIQVTFPFGQDDNFRVETYRILNDIPDSLLFPTGKRKNMLYNHEINYICDRPFEGYIDTSKCNLPVFVFVEEQAEFQGGTLDNFRQWVQKQLVYPPQAVEQGISGRITVQFVVTTEGNVDCIKILRSRGDLLDHETLRVMRLSPPWSPARQDGKAVNQQFVMPVIFQLQ